MNPQFNSYSSKSPIKPGQQSSLSSAKVLGSHGIATAHQQRTENRGSANGNDKLHPSGKSSYFDSRRQSSSHFPNGNVDLVISGSISPSGAANEAQSQTRHADDHRSPANISLPSQRATSFPGDHPSLGPRSNPESGTSNQPQYHSMAQQIPGSLQPGRPGLTSLNSTSSGTTNTQTVSLDHFSTPARPSGSGLTHTYTRSSPAGFESHMYTPFTPKTPQNNEQFSSPTNQNYTPQNSQRVVSNTPLGLADIRPRADSGVSEGLSGGNYFSNDVVDPGPKTSNYQAPWALYAFDWCKWQVQGDDAGKVAVGSYLEDSQNFIQILDSHITPTPPELYKPGASKYTLDFVKVAEATHSYPVTRLLWEPPSSQKQSTDLLATSGDHLRLWSLPSENPPKPQGNLISRSTNHSRDAAVGKITPLALLSNSKTPDHTAPLTSLDWNTISPSLIITSSIDTTCTIWDIPTLTAKTQLIAHDKEVFDVRFCANSIDVFVSCGADGSVRMFDLRSLEHSTIIYEPSSKDEKDSSANGGRISPTLAQQTMSYAPPLLRLATSPHDTHLLATFSQDSKIIRILDVRQPGQALLELKGHAAAINCIEWSPSRRGTLASGADDSLVLIWDLLNQNIALPRMGQTANGHDLSDNSRGPSAGWQCEYEVANVSWAPHSSLDNDGGDWLGVSGGRGIWGVRL
ncbi:Bgt-2321 [Blumeria graminis f. sp. tritici]|uniref:Bgt-2321 n=2 Tax=Blumeria graminis f. sp. tritici TaxID=62690 RepID=A0A9X9LB58_BLUGR|nr:hypothetical protein BGT96224_2321 [Blumeria graminis f. sp. tritici 96224]VCU40815.1 Bgt-2321 [Blumeria graminis f. sp. tritici]